jgi:hypothetical protein
MSPLRWDVLAVGFLLALPLVALGLRGDFTTSEVTARLPWCLLAGYVVVAVLRFAGKPRGAQSATSPAADDPTP